jgi:hypothetical protein
MEELAVLFVLVLVTGVPGSHRLLQGAVGARRDRGTSPPH